MTTRCYGIDGTPYANFGRYIPCNTTAAATGGHTSCCAPGDNCLTNGLCQGQGDNKRKANLFWRNGCTDPTWDDPSCAKHCEGLDNPDTHGIFYCLQSNSWCCPTGAFNGGQTLNTTCCSRSDLVFSAADPLVYTIAEVNIMSTIASSARTSTSIAVALSSATASAAGISTSSSVAQPTSSQPAPASSTSTSAPASSSPSSSSDNNKLGIYVGVPLGIALAIALAVIAWLVIKNRKSKPVEHAPLIQPGVYTHGEKRPAHAEAELGIRPEELSDGREVAVELPQSNCK